MLTSWKIFNGRQIKLFVKFVSKLSLHVITRSITNEYIQEPNHSSAKFVLKLSHHVITWRFTNEYMQEPTHSSAKFVQELSKLLHKIVSQLQIFHKVNNWSSSPSWVWLVKVGNLSWWIGVEKVGKFEILVWLRVEILAENKKQYVRLTLEILTENL